MTNAVAKKLEATLEVPTTPMTPMQMLELAVSSGASPEALEKIMNLHERWEAAQAKKAFDAAMAAVKANLPTIIKTKKVSGGGGYGFKHETLTGIAKLIDPVLSENGLSYRFRTSSDATTVTVICVMSHKLGHSEETSLTGPHDKSGGKNSIQAVGSAVTYLERYSLKAALGMAAADDDDAALVDKGENITQEQQDKLIEALEAKGADRAKFLKWAKVESVDQILSSQYDSCMTAISNYKVKSA